MTKIAICGACGKMGRFIYDVMSERDDCTVSAGIDKFGEAYADFPVVKEPADLPEKPDVIIDFSHPSALDGLLSYCLSNGTALVIAIQKRIQRRYTRLPSRYLFSSHST